MIDLKTNLSDSDLGRFYSTEDSIEYHDEDSDRHYAELLHLYGDADDWARTKFELFAKQMK